MTTRPWLVLVGSALVVVTAFSACDSPTRRFAPTEEMGGAPGTGGGGGTTSGTAGACSAGDERCEGLGPERCTEASEWAPSRADCAVACLGGQCVPCVQDARTCKDGAVQRCDAGAWTTVEVCTNVCQGDTCVDACTEDLLQCNGNRTLQKCVGGEFVTERECEVACIDGACVDECVPDTRRCNPDAPDESQSCNAQGNWDRTVPCAQGTFCVAGDCKPCAPSTTRCSPSGPQLCSDAGEWVNQGTCTGANAACLDGRCVVCTPSEKRCGENVVEACLPDGTAWEVVETCAGDTPACLDATKTCGRCTEGDTQCLGDGLQTCDDEGVFQPAEACDASTPQCVGNECTECDPVAGERRCSSATETQKCESDGTWAAAVRCTGDTPQCREDLGFDCGCEEGTRRCRTNTTNVPEECQGGAWVAQVACAGTLDYCLPATGECVDCIPDSAECINGIAHQCTDAGSFESLNSCSGPGINCGNCGVGEPCADDSECRTGICVQDRCVVCEPDSVECVGSTPRLCSSDGVWTNQNNCSGSTPQCLPSTGQCVACLDGATRSCGNCNTGTQTCNNNAWGTCTGAVDLETSNQYCGSCATSCSSSQVCEDGTCLPRCSTGQTRCGTNCVNLSTDTSNCLSCGNRCTPPASDGAAVCTASGCDISCSNSRCGTSCCPPAPARATAGCSGNTCTFTCSSGNHGCGGSTPPCYSNTDGTKCGPSCLNCGSYVGTTGACANNACTCEGSSTLACGANTPTCGSWDFDSNTIEGWRYGDYYEASAHYWVGNLGTQTTNGSPALMAKVDSVASGWGPIVEFEVDLCPNGALVNLSNHVLSYDFYFLTTGGGRFSLSPNDATDTFIATNGQPLLGCQPFADLASDQWLSAQCANLPNTLGNLTLVFRISNAWAGTVFVDNVRFTPK